MTDTTDNKKNTNASLVAFNNHIVSMKNVVKRGKVNEIQKLVRKIKLLAKKKGNETQLEKNKRKCEHLKTEISSIKRLKFNDVAIFAFENEGVQFSDYLKSNKQLSAAEIALARLGFGKPVRDSVEKVKTDSRIDGWKRTFIQYKSRCEKRRSWKEKTRLLNEIESNLKLVPEKEDGPDAAEAEPTEKPEKKVKENVKKIEKGNKKEEKKPQKESPESENDSDSDSDEPTMSLELRFSDDESSEDEPSQARDSEDDDVQNDDHISESEHSEESMPEDEDSSEVESDSARVVPAAAEPLKPLVIASKPAKMEIKQLNLDEIKDCNEIPIEEKRAVSEDESEAEKKEKKPNKREDPEQAVYDPETGKYERRYRVATIKVNEDPFFLDQDGREIYNGNTSGVFREKRPWADRNNDTGRFGRDKFNNSFRSNLSDKAERFAKRNADEERQRPWNSDRKPANGARYDSKFKGGSSYERPGKPNESKESPVDVGNLHPSWQAKKLMEEKIKSMKFEGKKLKFGDDD